MGWRSSIAEDFESGGGDHLVKAMFTEQVLMEHLGAWFDGTTCKKRAAQVASEVESAAKRHRGLADEVAELVAEWATITESLTAAEWCLHVKQFHRHASQLEEEARAGHEAWYNANRRLLELPLPRQSQRDEL